MHPATRHVDFRLHRRERGTRVELPLQMSDAVVPMCRR